RLARSSSSMQRRLQRQTGRLWGESTLRTRCDPRPPRTPTAAAWGRASRARCRCSHEVPACREALGCSRSLWWGRTLRRQTPLQSRALMLGCLHLDAYASYLSDFSCGLLPDGGARVRRQQDLLTQPQRPDRILLWLAHKCQVLEQTVRAERPFGNLPNRAFSGERSTAVRVRAPPATRPPAIWNSPLSLCALRVLGSRAWRTTLMPRLVTS